MPGLVFARLLLWWELCERNGRGLPRRHVRSGAGAHECILLWSLCSWVVLPRSIYKRANAAVPRGPLRRLRGTVLERMQRRLPRWDVRSARGCQLISELHRVPRGNIFHGSWCRFKRGVRSLRRGYVQHSRGRAQHRGVCHVSCGDCEPTPRPRRCACVREVRRWVHEQHYPVPGVPGRVGGDGRNVRTVRSGGLQRRATVHVLQVVPHGPGFRGVCGHLGEQLHNLCARVLLASTGRHRV